MAPYHYLCDGQLSNCVSQPGTERRLDSQGDKLMQRLVYRNFGDHESILAEHSIATAAHGGGVRWYEFRLNKQRDPVLYQQGTYAPGRILSLAGKHGDGPQGQHRHRLFLRRRSQLSRPALRRAPGERSQRASLPFTNPCWPNGKASQTGSLRWEDYTNIAVDPSDDCTFWFVGNYLKSGATSSTTRIGSFAVPGCK